MRQFAGPWKDGERRQMQGEFGTVMVEYRLGDKFGVFPARFIASLDTHEGEYVGYGQTDIGALVNLYAEYAAMLARKDATLLLDWERLNEKHAEENRQ